MRDHEISRRDFSRRVWLVPPPPLLPQRVPLAGFALVSWLFSALMYTLGAPGKLMDVYRMAKARWESRAVRVAVMVPLIVVCLFGPLVRAECTGNVGGERRTGN